MSSIARTELAERPAGPGSVARRRGLNRLLQSRLNVKLTQRQALTPSLVQMVSVLALNKLELKDMINGELVENPVLEELEESAETLDERSAKEGTRERS